MFQRKQASRHGAGQRLVATAVGALALLFSSPSPAQSTAYSLGIEGPRLAVPPLEKLATAAVMIT